MFTRLIKKICPLSLSRIDDCRILLWLPQSVYEPDSWSELLATGINQYLKGRQGQCSIVEYGIGSGVIPIYLSRRNPNSVNQYLGFDINRTACRAAQVNSVMNFVKFPVISQYETVLSLEDKAYQDGKSHLNGDCSSDSTRPDSLQATNDVNIEFQHPDSIIVANIPQTPYVNGKTADFTPNDYYELSKESGDVINLYNQCGLGLLYQLCQIAAKNEDKPDMIFTIAGRPGKETIDTFFQDVSESHTIIKTIRIEQDKETSISPFLELQKSFQVDCEFYDSENSSVSIGAVEAFERIEKGDQIFHDLHVVKITPSSANFSSERPPAIQ